MLDEIFIQEEIGRALQAYFKPVTTEFSPDFLVALLARLAQAECAKVKSTTGGESSREEPPK